MKKNIKCSNMLILIVIFATLYFVVEKELLFLIPIIFVGVVLWLINKMSKLEMIIYGLLLVIFIIYLVFIPNYYSNYYVKNLLETKTKFFELRNKLFNFIDSNYNNKKTAAFIKYFMFNKKDAELISFMKNLKGLGIIHLFTISGFHINIFMMFFKVVFKKLKKNKRLAINLTNLMFILVYGYFLGFTVSILRILFTVCFEFFFEKTLASILSCLLNIFLFYNIILNFGFILSYGCVFSILAVQKIKCKKFVTYLLVNLICFLFALFIQLDLENQINILSPLFVFIFSPIICFLYIWFMITMFIFPIQVANDWIVNNLLTLINNIAMLGLFIKYYKETKYLIPIYYSGFLLLWNFKIKDEYDYHIKGKNYQKQ